MENKKTVIYDLETLKNCITYVDIDKDSDTINKFVLHKDRNDFDKFIDYLLTSVRGMIGFNSVGFDYPIMHLILSDHQRLSKLPIEVVIDLIYQKAQDIIAAQNMDFGQYQHQIPEWKMIIPQLDLFRIWHFDNKAKRTSLKKIEIAINWPNVLDMPIHHSDLITLDQIEEILEYNLNDVLCTKEFFRITRGYTENKLYKGVDKIQLRNDIQDQFGIKCSNYNDVKIGDEINKINYIKATGIEKSELRDMKTERAVIHLKDCVPDFIKFDSIQLQDFLNRVKVQSIVNINNGFKESIIYKGVKFTFAQGGIHSVDSGNKIIPKEDEILEDRDVALTTLAQLKFG